MMKRIIPWLMLLLGTAGCIDRTRVNEGCVWDSGADPLDLNDRQLDPHLEQDSELATELAVRYADAFHRGRFGYEGHGGLIDNGRLRDGCMATLLMAIAKTHHVPVSRVTAARARLRRPVLWDATVILLFAVGYGYVSWLIARSVYRRFPADEGWPTIAAVAIMAGGSSALAACG